MPVVILADPGMKKIYGSYNHAALRGQDYRGIFRDVKDEVREAIKAGTFSNDLAVAEADTDTAAADYQPEEVESEGLAKVADPQFETWTSSAGSEIVAKLIAVQDDITFIFESKDGKTIRTTADKLSVETVRRARELAR